jgi:hypothetical protein
MARWTTLVIRKLSISGHVVILMNARVVVAHYAEFLAYEGVAMQLAITARGLIVYAASAQIDSASRR